jgi:hypothetical protein
MLIFLQTELEEKVSTDVNAKMLTKITENLEWQTWPENVESFKFATRLCSLQTWKFFLVRTTIE